MGPSREEWTTMKYIQCDKAPYSKCIVITIFGINVQCGHILCEFETV
jgi:hypothetical protein